MRRALDLLYGVAAGVAALCLIGALAMILASIAGRLLHFHLRGADAYAGYLIAAAAFLALAQTFRRGEHIRVTLLLERLGSRGRRMLQLGSHAVALLLAGLLAWFSVRLVWQSFLFNDISQGNDATPLWIPQLAMALGSLIFVVAIADGLIDLWRRPAGEHGAPPEAAMRSK